MYHLTYCIYYMQTKSVYFKKIRIREFFVYPSSVIRPLLLPPFPGRFQVSEIRYDHFLFPKCCPEIRNLFDF